MDLATRVKFLQTATPASGESWADLGCGDGAFAIPLAEMLGDGGSLVAIDREAVAVAALRKSLATSSRPIPRQLQLRVGSVESPGALPPLDGVLFANVLHYVSDPVPVLKGVLPLLKNGGRILVIEYDRSDASAWVPYPIPVSALPELARRAGVPAFNVAARARSDFGRVLYAAVSRLG
jgi:ubiquinone/menaquinone biosynthesis C-methylase UbiE